MRNDYLISPQRLYNQLGPDYPKRHAHKFLGEMTKLMHCELISGESWTSNLNCESAFGETLRLYCELKRK